MLKDLTYRVVVIDDEVDLYDDYIEYIENYLSAEGYRLEKQRFEELEELDSESLDNVDLFLVDLKFGKEDKGPEFIKKIRENHLTDILFYSSDSAAIQANRQSGEYEGVFFAIRDENQKTILLSIQRLLDKMIKRSNTPLSTRGIVLGCVAELDNIIKQKIALMLSLLSPKQQQALMDECVKQYHSSYKGQSNKIRDFFGCEFHGGITPWASIKTAYSCKGINELVNNVSVTDSSKNFHVLLKTYKKLRGEDDFYQTISAFFDLLNDRNIFAHVQEELNADGLYQFKRLNSDDYLVLSSEKCRDLRKAIIGYALHMDSIKEE